MRRVVAAVGICLGLFSTPAAAQVMVAPPGVYIPGPPRIFWRPRRVVVLHRAPVYVQPAYPVYPGYQAPYYPPPPNPPTVIYAPPPPPIVVYAPPVVVYAPPPPVVVYAPPPVYVAQPQVYAPPPEACPPNPCGDCQEPPLPVAAAVAAKPTTPDWPHTVGIGFRFGGQIENTDWHHLSFGGELLFRTSARTVVEVSGEYQQGVNNDLDRLNVPVGLGLRIHLAPPTWVVSPYLVAAGVFTYSRLDLKAAVDDAYYLGGQVGGGLELRLGKRAAITADARFDGRVRMDDPSLRVASITSVNGQPVKVAKAGDSEYGGVFRLGAAVYF